MTVVLAAAVAIGGIQDSDAAAIGTPIANPEYVNIFWDQQWDKDSPGMTMAEINNATEAIINSTYFSTLREYGVMNATFNSQAFVADPSCGNQGTTPSNVGTWSIFGGATLTSFIDCESALQGVPNAGNVVYNVFLPPEVTSCPGSDPGDHFQSSGHAFAFIDTNPACMNGNSLERVFTYLSHEMVEAATDPFTPWPHIFPKNEIADVCPGSPTGFLPDFHAGTSMGPAVSQYQNSSGVCVTGFTDTTAPSIAKVQFTFGADAQQPEITILGTGFGGLPVLTTFAGGGPGSVNGQTRSGPPFTTDVPYFAFDDIAAGWQAGNSIDDNGITVSFQSWSDGAIQISGFGGAYGEKTDILSAGDKISVIVCNPASGQCISTPSITYTPEAGGMISVIVCNPASGPCPSTPSPMTPVVVTGLKPTSGPAAGGSTVEVDGTGFTNPQDTTVLFDGMPGTVRNVSTQGTSITVTAPAGLPGAAVVQVQDSNGASNSTGTTANTFTYCGPTLTGIVPSAGAAGYRSRATLSGSCLTGAYYVDFGAVGRLDSRDIPPDMTVRDDGHIVVSTPPDACGGVADVQVISPDRYSFVTSNPVKFCYEPPHVVSAAGCRPRSVWHVSSPCITDPWACSPVLGLKTLTARQPSPPPVFTDLTDYKWALPAVEIMARQHVMNGIAPGRFDPGRVVSRGEFAILLSRVVDLQRPPGPAAFADVRKGDPWYESVNAFASYLDAYHEINGAYAFHPTQPIDRQIAAATVASLLVASHRIADLRDMHQVIAILKSAHDADSIAPHLRPFVAAAIRYGLFGLHKGYFIPRGTVTRAQLAFSLQRLEVLLTASQ